MSMLVVTPGWGVSCMTGTGIKGAILHVTKRHQSIIRKGDAYGRVFANSEEARLFALSRGYLRQYLHSEVSCAKKIHRKSLGPLMNIAVAQVRAGIDPTLVVTGLRQVILAETSISCVDSLRWTNAIYKLARKFRGEAR